MASLFGWTIVKKKPSDGVYIGANPEYPHAGFAVFSAEKIAQSIHIKEVNCDFAKANLMGKVIDWERFPDKKASTLKNKGVVTVSLEALMGLFK